jgi:hypothetical protein
MTTDDYREWASDLPANAARPLTMDILRAMRDAIDNSSEHVEEFRQRVQGRMDAHNRFPPGETGAEYLAAYNEYTLRVEEMAERGKEPVPTWEMENNERKKRVRRRP